MLGNTNSPFSPLNHMVAHSQFHGFSTSSSAGEEEGNVGCKKFIKIFFLTGFAITVILGVIFGINVANDSSTGASILFMAMIIAVGVTMVVTTVSGAIMALKGKASPSNRRGRSSSQFTASVRDQLGSETNQLGSETNQTIERFFIGMARDRPIRFTRQELHSFTNNFSEKLGASGFGIVYKGEFSGANIAVKVLQLNSYSHHHTITPKLIW